MKRQGGFTLIELVVVIVILGILAVTAAPRFLNLQSDAREAAIQGLAGAMNGGAGIVYGKAAIDGKEAKAAQTVDGIDTEFGYPAATDDGIGEAVVGLGDSSTEWSSAAGTDTGDGEGTYVATFYDSTYTTEALIVATECYVTYTEAADKDDTYSVVVTDVDGC